MLPALFILGVALLVNITVRYGLRFLGKFRTGIDALLFCAIMTGYFYGITAGIAYGAFIAITFYLMNLRQISHAPYVVLLNAAAGGLAAVLATTTPLITAAVYALFFYHIISFIIVLFAYRSIGFGYFLFAALNFITTLLLIGFFAGF